MGRRLGMFRKTLFLFPLKSWMGAVVLWSTGGRMIISEGLWK